MYYRSEDLYSKSKIQYHWNGWAQVQLPSCAFRDVMSVTAVWYGASFKLDVVKFSSLQPYQDCHQYPCCHSPPTCLKASSKPCFHFTDRNAGSQTSYGNPKIIQEIKIKVCSSISLLHCSHFLVTWRHSSSDMLLRPLNQEADLKLI